MKFPKFHRNLATLLMAVSMPLSMLAAVKDLPVKRVNGKLYHYYEVPAKETVYSLCYKFDMTRDELVRNNPAVADGLQAGMTLYFPIDGEDYTDIAANTRTVTTTTTHDVQRGETIFGISHKYGITSEQLLEANPSLKNGLKAGQTINIPVTTAEAVPARAVSASTDLEPKPAVAETEGYIVKKKETFYSIAVAHGVSVAALEAANPGVTSLREGQVLNIPVKSEPKDVVTVVPVAVVEAPVAADVEPLPAAPVKPSDISVAVMLPFMLNEENPSKAAQRYTEFYKGFLMAVDSLRGNGMPIHVTAYDTEGSVLKIKEALSDSAFAQNNLIIAPDNAPQLAILAEWARNNNAKVFNTFLVRDDSYLTNPAVMQGNLPSQLMYRKAIDGLMERLSVSTPVFISVKGEKGDKADFVADLRQALSAKGKTYLDIEIDGRLTSTDLLALPTDGNYTFIPESSRQAELNKIMPGIIEWRDKAITPLVRLFGYPEWTTFRGETLSNMHNLNTTVYSRFYTDEESWRTRSLDSSFRRWYGTRMESAVPRQGILGFDTGMFLIPYVKSDGEVAGYDGVQNGYYFSSGTPGAGSYNEALYFINFRPGNSVEKTRL